MNKEFAEYSKKLIDTKDKQSVAIKRYDKFIKRQLIFFIVIICSTVFWVVYQMTHLFLYKTSPTFLSFDFYVPATFILSFSIIIVGEITRRRYLTRMAMFHVELDTLTNKYFETLRLRLLTEEVSE